MDKIFNQEIENSIRKRRLYLGGSMVLDNDFDINNYLIDVQKQIDLEKINFNKKISLPPIKTNQNGIRPKRNYSNFNTINFDFDNIYKRRKIFINKTNSNEKKPLSTLNNLLILTKNNLGNISNSNSKRSSTINTDFNEQKKLLEVNNYIQSTRKKIEKIIKKHKESTKSSNSILNKRISDMFITSEPRFNIMKEIKQIKKREKYSSQINIVGDNDKNLKRNFKSRADYEELYNNMEKNQNNNKNIIAFDKKHVNEVFEPIRVLNNYKIQEQLHINPQDKFLNNFSNQNKELTINSVLLKLMNKENNKLYKNFNLHADQLKNNQKEIEENEANFEEYTETHKKACKDLDTLYVSLQKKNKELIQENLKTKSDIKLIEDEMRRILHQIEYLRVYAYFVNEVLGGDTTRFENKIFPEQKYDEEIDFEELSKTVIEQYQCFYENVGQEKFETEKTFIDEPEKMWYKFKEMESIMVRDIYLKEDIKGEIKKLKEENIINLKDLRQKNEMLQNEYDNLYGQFNFEMKKFEIIEQKYNGQKNEFDDLIKNLYVYVNNCFNKDYKIIDVNKIYDKLYSADCIGKINNIICEKEIYIDKLITDLKNWEKKDQKLFDTIVNNRKKELKHTKQLKILKEKMNEKLKYVKNVESGKGNIFIFSRKTEAPYHKPKKVVKVKVDQKLIEQMENEELLKYEDNED